MRIIDWGSDVCSSDLFIDMLLPALEMLERKDRIADPKKPLSLGSVKGKIICKNVDFAYAEQDTEVPIFKNLNLVVPAGQKLGEIGRAWCRERVCQYV